MSGADLSGANLSGANLSGADLPAGPTAPAHESAAAGGPIAVNSPPPGARRSSRQAS
ncbi:pentapeptide repeat-containing protein [Streptomyces sp. NPDC056304]|uniref:pentapeptide repeat-containing protein n=1 Tax=Streptomyces sp. NPDC056304 TaxID=3345778 RepID=UPI0035D65DE4